ncbi:MAG: TolC family protein [Saprospiraceae bacterium]|nr:TolC family protein [Saprospiraceae bacterium]
MRLPAQPERVCQPAALIPGRQCQRRDLGECILGRTFTQSTPVRRFAHEGRVQRAEVTEQNTNVQLLMLEQQIDMSIQNARNQYSSAMDKLRNQEKNLAMAERIYDTTRTKYREGVGSSLEINQAEQALFAAQRQHVQAQYDVVRAIQSLENALGK